MKRRKFLKAGLVAFALSTGLGRVSLDVVSRGFRTDETGVLTPDEFNQRFFMPAMSKLADKIDAELCRNTLT